MDESDYEGSLVLEQVAQSGLLDELYEAIDSDDFSRAKRILKRAGIDSLSIATTLQKMRDSEID